MPRRVPLPPSLSSGPFSVAQAYAAGLGEGRLRGSDLERPFHGVRSASESRASIQAFCRAYLPRLRPGQFFSHWTAAQLWLAPLPVPFDSSENLHVSTTAPNRAPRARFVTGHQVTDPLASVHTRFELPTADPATTWLQLAPTLSESNLVAVADHLVLTPVYAAPPERRPYLTLDELARRAYAYRGPGSKRARASLLRVRQGAESRPETLVRLMLVDAGLPEPELNVEVWGPNGEWLGRGDMLYFRWMVLVEYDGDQHRTNTEQYEKDMARRERFRRANWDGVYIRKRGLQHPDETVERVRTSLLRAGWRP
jgi:hypothetical protein